MLAMVSSLVITIIICVFAYFGDGRCGGVYGWVHVETGSAEIVFLRSILKTLAFL